MALILNIETATEIGSVCVAKDGKVLSTKESNEQMVHARDTTLMIAACLKEVGILISELDAIALSQGPGSYTALRVGSSTAKGICYAMDIPLISISTLESLALASAELSLGDFYCPMIDARRKEVYTAIYNNKFTEILPCSAVILTDDFIADLSLKSRIVFSGNGAPKLQEITTPANFIHTNIRCSAMHLSPLSINAFREKNFVDIAYFEPTYLKPPNITKSKKKL